VEQVGMGFIFAQTFNKSMRFVGQARRKMKICTIFNILGPLANVTTFSVTPEQFGFIRASKEELKGATGVENAEITKES